MPDLDLPVAGDWFAARAVGQDTALIIERHVDVLMQAHLWHVRGRDHDLLIDGGMGIVPLRPCFPELFDGRRTIALATHRSQSLIGP